MRTMTAARVGLLPFLLLAFLLLLAHAAHAATVAGSVDLAPLVSYLLPFAGAILLGLAGAVARWLQVHLRTAGDAQANALITGAGARGAGLAYEFLAAQGAHVGNVPLKNAALAIGTKYVLDGLPEALKRLQVTPDRVQAIVQAEFGKLLGLDPSVSVAPPTVDAKAIVPVPNPAPVAPVDLAPAALPAPAAA